MPIKPNLLDLNVRNERLRPEHERIRKSLLIRQPGVDNIPERLVRDYPPGVMSMTRAAWKHRTWHEHQSAAVFSAIFPQLIEAGASIEYKTTILRCAMDEIHHAELCARVLGLLGGEPVVEADLELTPAPRHADAPLRSRPLRNLIFASCMSETIGGALQAAQRELTEEPYIREVLDQLSGDEVLHARIGWLYLGDVWPGLDTEERKAVLDYLPLAFSSIESAMLGVMPLGPPPPADLEPHLRSLGWISGDEAREILYQVIDEVVVPQLESVMGSPVREAWKIRSSARTGGVSAAPIRY
ncbi:MAG: hypothetical protein GMKNLPBB_01151 [Myxococcota bacterium]|nr:hypothetical protein [Myxococcota bacterium]